MYNEQILVDHLKRETGYNVSLATEKQIDIVQEEVVIPKLYIGHTGIHLQNPSIIWTDGYQEQENSQVLLTEIHILCLRNNLYEVRNIVYKSYIKFDPVPDEDSFSTISFYNGKLIGRTGIKIWWLETIAMVFPRILI